MDLDLFSHLFCSEALLRVWRLCIVMYVRVCVCERVWKLKMVNQLGGKRLILTYSIRQNSLKLVAPNENEMSVNKSQKMPEEYD